MQSLQDGYLVISRIMEKDILKGFLLVAVDGSVLRVSLDNIVRVGYKVNYYNAEYDAQYKTLVGINGNSLTKYPSVTSEYVLTSKDGIVVLATILDANTKKPIGVVAFNGLGGRFNLSYKRLNELSRKYNCCNFNLVNDKNYGFIAVQKDGSYFGTVEMSVPNKDNSKSENSKPVLQDSNSDIPVVQVYSMDFIKDNEFSQSCQEKLVLTMLNMQALTPYYYTILQAIKRVPAPNFGTMGVTEDTLFYDMGFVANLQVSELTFVLIHEIMHIAMLHSIRFKGRNNHDLWNIATDLYINSIICNDFGCKFGGEAVNIGDSIKPITIKAPNFGVFIDTIGETINLSTDTPETIYARLLKENGNSSTNGNQGNNLGNSHGQSGDNQGQSGNNQGQSGNNQGQSGNNQGQSGNNQLQQGINNIQNGANKAQSQVNQSNNTSARQQAQQAQQQIQQGSQNVQQGLQNGNQQQVQQGIQQIQQGIQNMNNAMQQSGQQGQGQSNASSQMETGQQQLQSALKQGQNNNNSSQDSDNQLGSKVDDVQPTEGDITDNSNSSDNDDSGFTEVNVTYNGKRLKGTIIKDVMSNKEAKTEDAIKSNIEASKKALQKIDTRIKLEEKDLGIELVKNAGNSAGLMQRYIEFGLSSGVDWRVLLRNMCKDKPKKTFTLAQPNQDYMNMGMTIADRRPIGKPTHIAHVKFCVDVSGSVSQSELGTILSEINNIYSYYKVDGELIYWSAMVGNAGMFSNLKDLLKITPVSDGGTDVRCVFEYLAGETKVNKQFEKDKIKDIKAIFILTDGCFGHNYDKYAKCFGRKVVWLITGKKGNPVLFDPPFGRVLGLNI